MLSHDDRLRTASLAPRRKDALGAKADGNNTVVTIDASQSSDPDGDALTFSWVVPGGTFDNGTGPGDPTIQVTFPGAAPYTVRVTVNDVNGGSDEVSVTITLS